MPTESGEWMGKFSMIDDMLYRIALEEVGGTYRR